MILMVSLLLLPQIKANGHIVFIYQQSYALFLIKDLNLD